MNTLEEAQTYFQSKGYNAEFSKYRREDDPIRLMVRGRQRPKDPQTEIIAFGSGLFILFADNMWHLECREINYYKLQSKFVNLPEAVSAAKAILGPPFEERK
jgi:hypothetical protein